MFANAADEDNMSNLQHMCCPRQASGYVASLTIAGSLLGLTSIITYGARNGSEGSRIGFYG